MKVYVIMLGVHEWTVCGGVYSSPEAAMQAHPIRADYPYADYPLSRPGGWRRTSETLWDNGQDWQDAATIEAYELDGPPRKIPPSVSV